MAKDKQETEEAQAFRVVDHRRFNPDGSEKDGEGEKTPHPGTPSPLTDEAKAQKAAPEGTPQAAERPPVEEEEKGKISFSDLVLSLAASAQIHLGVSPSPFTQQVEKDLPQAAQNIDLLGILSEKTQGNLTEEEGQLLEVILADLRMRFVKETKKQ